MADVTGAVAGTAAGARAMEGASVRVHRIGVFDATMLVMGGIVGAGIFSNPYVVARIVGRGWLMLLAWGIGGVIALAGAFVYAELAARHPARGGHYAYMRDAFHPVVAFMFGWAILLVVQTGGLAAVAVTFARYFLAVVPLALPESLVAVLAVAILTGVNCAGVEAGNAAQRTFMLLKITAIVSVIGGGIALLVRGGATAPASGPAPRAAPFAVAAALTPVMFAYGGWQTASFVQAELRHPARDLSRAMLYGVVGVVALYLAVNAVFLLALGERGLAATTTPAAAMLDRVGAMFGARRASVGGEIVAGFVALSTLGFLSQALFAVPRVYQAMAADGLFFRAIARISPRTHAPVRAIALQGAFIAIVAALGTYESIMSYVTSVDFIFYGLAAVALLVFRRREQRREGSAPQLHTGYSAPLQPWLTLFFLAASGAVVLATVASDPAHALVGIGFLALGAPAYVVWRRLTARAGGAGRARRMA